MPGGQPEDPDINIGGGGGGDSSSSSGGGDSSSSSGGGDPWFGNRQNAAMFSQFQSVYQQLWGVPASEGYIKAAINKGLNVWEFADLERHKPAWFRRSQAARSASSSFAKMLHDLGIV